MKLLLATLFLSLCPLVICAQPKNRESIRLWSGDAPGALGPSEQDIPTLTVYWPTSEKSTGAAMIICPGGGYSVLAKHEGEDYALWLCDQGIAGFVLKYRLGRHGYRHPVPLQDAARAVRLVRTKADEWKLNPKRIGLMGSSAGGHLTATLLTHFDAGRPDAEDVIERQSSRPDLGILCYPVITMGEKTHGGSKANLLGKEPTAELIKELSNELHVTPNTPPCFLFHTVADTSVPVENSQMFAAALRQAGVPFALHLYEKGSHGLGLGFKVYATYQPGQLHPWTGNCLYWLQQHEFLP